MVWKIGSSAAHWFIFAPIGRAQTSEVIHMVLVSFCRACGVVFEYETYDVLTNNLRGLETFRNFEFCQIVWWSYQNGRADQAAFQKGLLSVEATLH